MTRTVSRSIILIALGLLAGPVLPATSPAAALAAAPAAVKTARSFTTPGAAVDALVAAMRHGDMAALHAVLGPGSGKLVSSGDPVADKAQRQRFLDAYDAHHALVPDALGRMVLHVGAHDWPLPLPIARAGDRWRFDSRLGAEQMVDRRIGENELAAIRTALVFVDAQKAYFAMTEQAGHGEYARRWLSTQGHRDGLYWPATAGAPESPLAPLVEQAEEEGYAGAILPGQPSPYHGYLFRILTAQGPYAPGGAMGYLTGGRMTRGFALLAWPARYGASGVMSFAVNQDGIVFQKDLGPQTAEAARRITQFDPDLSWTRVDVEPQ